MIILVYRRHKIEGIISKIYFWKYISNFYQRCIFLFLITFFFKGPGASCCKIMPSEILRSWKAFLLIFVQSNFIIPPKYNWYKKALEIQYYSWRDKIGSIFSTVFIWESDRYENKIWISSINIRFPGGSDCKESACNAGEPGSIPGSGKSLEKGMASHSSILT